MNEADIIEIFKSFQGEGLYIGVKQLFIRFANCNLKCSYCDTTERNSEICSIYNDNNSIDKINNPVSIEIVNDYIKNNIYDFDMISFTGNEPLLNYKFIKEICLFNRNIKTFLETNSTLPENLEKIIKYIDIVSADYKWESESKNFDRFIGICMEHNKELYIKIVVNKDFSEKKIDKFLNLKLEKNISIIIQPQTNNKTLKLDINLSAIEEIHRNIRKYFYDVRMIPQSHRFINLK